MKRVDTIDPNMFVNTIANAYHAQSEGVPDYYSLNFIDLVGIDTHYIGASRSDIRDAVEAGYIELASYDVAVPSGASPRLLVNDPASWAAYMTANAYVNDTVSNALGVYERYLYSQLYNTAPRASGTSLLKCVFEYCSPSDR